MSKKNYVAILAGVCAITLPVVAHADEVKAAKHKTEKSSTVKTSKSKTKSTSSKKATPAKAATAPAAAMKPVAYQAWVGSALNENSWYSYLGGVTAINKDLDRNGVLVRVTTGYGFYNYDRAGVAAGGVKGTVTSTDLMVGYQMFASVISNAAPSRFTVYGGGEYQDHNLNKTDKANNAQGSEWGFKGLAEAHINLCPKTSLNLAGSYSGVFNSYWSNARLGYNIAGVTVGPEAGFLGNKAFDAQQYGAFVGDIPVVKNLVASVSGGYENSVRRGDDGAYGNVNLSVRF